ncbi:MAG: pyridoxamine 5'-phosphate oxidase family protein [Burkholderiales bacterium]|nr:pyridoxamine 5'-phosphate oxidase family protein [Flavobacterium sp.]
MNSITNLSDAAAIEKLQDLVDDIDVCLFCTNLKNDNVANCRPMSAQKVDNQGNLWFFSDINSEKNREIKHDNQVQLFFSSPSRNSYLIINGHAEIVIDRNKTQELWSPLVRAWFKEGKDDPNISILKVVPDSAYYWNTEGNTMFNFFKKIVTAATGKNLTETKHGNLQL